MNERVPTPATTAKVPAVAAPKPPKIRRDDREFLPAAVMLVETPPSPVRLWLSTTICLLIAGSIAWGWFGRIDIIAEAQGKVQPAGRVKTVQPVEGGIIRKVLATNGARVAAGDVLVELDVREAAADRDEAASGLASYEAEAIRRQAEIIGARDASFAAPAVEWPKEATDYLRAREQRVLKNDLSQLSSTVDSLDAQKNQKEEERKHLVSTIAAQQRLIGIQKERLAMREELVAKSAGTKKDLIDAEESVAYQETQLETYESQLAQANANLIVVSKDRAKAIDAFISDNSQKAADASRQADDFRQKLVKAQAKLDNATIRSPVNGTVTASTVLSPGQVVSAGDEIMRVVPEDADLEIEAYVQNADAGFVKPDQIAEVKLEPFPFTRYGSIQAKVLRVAHDAIPEPDAAMAEQAPSKASKSTSFGGAQRVQNLVFPVVLAPQVKTIKVDGVNEPISAGMAVTVEIRTGSRRILEYLFSPLVEIGLGSMKER